MKNTAIAIIAIVIGCCVVAAQQQQQQQTCEPGSRFRDADDCNWCWCGNDGVTVSCTKKFCGKIPFIRVRRSPAPNQVCVPSQRFKDSDGCNWCTCNQDGTMAACTRKFCPPKMRQRRDVTSAQVCEPGTRFMDAAGCNWCTCNKDGSAAACTRKFCVPKPTRTVREAQQCVPGSEFLAEDGCNTCFCNADGTLGGCTEKLCLTNADFHPDHLRVVRQANACQPGSRFRADDGCNWCTCNNDGSAAACTRKFCVPKPKSHARVTREAREAGQYCVPNSSFKDDCNTCICSADGRTAACTLRFCLPKEHRVRRQVPAETEEEKQICEPGSVFRDAEDCNNCFCNDKGTAAACTLKACFKLDLPTLSRKTRQVAQACVPNSTFKEDCNTCWCNEDGTSAACTLIGCWSNTVHETKSVEEEKPIAKREAEGQVCVPNSVYKEDCNTCICNEKGTAAACTLIGCLPKGWKPPRVVPDTPTETIRAKRQVTTAIKKMQICEPGSVTRAQDTCNTCRCSDDGTEMECTNVSCPALAGMAPAVCTPNSVFKQDCNTCKCSSQGDRAFCTRRMCRTTRDAPESEDKEADVVAQPPTPCTPDDIKIEGCNRCKCAKNGIVWLCTPGSACAPNGNGNGNGYTNHN